MEGCHLGGEEAGSGQVDNVDLGTCEGLGIG
jgi:hypothetical protein